MKLPKVNLCSLDRFIRGGIGVSLLIYVIFGYEHIGDPLLLSLILIFSILNLISFAIGWCPVYRLANISSCHTDD